MKKILFLTALLLSSFSLRAQKDTTWLVDGKINVTIRQYDTLYGVPQHVTIMEIDPSAYKFSFVNHHGLHRTSQMAQPRGEIVAMNGTFYDMDHGGSVCYFQIDGVMQDTTRFEEFPSLINGALKIKNGKIKIIDWGTRKEARFRARAAKKNLSNRAKKTSIMVTQPLLIKNGKKVPVIGNIPGFNDKKHNRSVLYLSKGKVYFLIIDGRHKGFAEGMTIDELQDYMLELKAEQAINLDGGGSSTLWANPELITIKADGVLNYPSDSEGERNIANHIGVTPK